MLLKNKKSSYESTCKPLNAFNVFKGFLLFLKVPIRQAVKAVN